MAPKLKLKPLKNRNRIPRDPDETAEYLVNLTCSDRDGSHRQADALRRGAVDDAAHEWMGAARLSRSDRACSHLDDHRKADRHRRNSTALFAGEKAHPRPFAETRNLGGERHPPIASGAFRFTIVSKIQHHDWLLQCTSVFA